VPRYGLGRKVRHDPRSRAFRIAADGTRASVQWNREIPVLDQGRLGSCTGNAGTGALGTLPLAAALPGGLLDSLTEAYAVALYSDATQVDGDPENYPPTDTGSDGLSIAKVLTARGLISGYQHAFGIADAFTAIQRGPLLVGVNWYEGMFDPDERGVVTVTGQLAGGHEFVAVGYDTAADLWHFVNSWGTGWAQRGHFFMSTDTFDRLLREQGDLISLVPVTKPAPTPAPVPEQPAAADLALLDGWAAARHTGSNAKAAAAWKRLRPTV
jgi:hypothetical protein